MTATATDSLMNWGDEFDKSIMDDAIRIQRCWNGVQHLAALYTAKSRNRLLKQSSRK